MKPSVIRLSALFVLSLAFLPYSPASDLKTSQTAAWESVGPAGGDARAFAADPTNPKHLYMGTLDSWVYESQNGGADWKRLAKLSRTDNQVLDNIVVDSADPKTILVGAWMLNRPDGALYISHDGGTSWATVADMEGQSIRALEQSRSNSKVFIAGTLKGVYRSDDGGAHWKQMSPPDSHEIHEVESIAIDPGDPNTVYAGTWHLPWKTTDGGATWHNVKQGLIDDSDVFSIILDPKTPAVVYLSACSGIYKSETAGEVFRKQQGIPNTARRTRVLMQDPLNAATVYAGTTEGLYRTTNGGTTWERLTGPDVIVNDVYVDPTNDKHVVLATDRSGVLLSVNGGASFVAANEGFSQRQVEALLVDARNPNTIYAGVLNDKAYGGVFVSDDAGNSWNQRSMGLDGRDVFVLRQTPGGDIYAGTNHGIMILAGGDWEPRSSIVNTKEVESTVVRKRKRVKVTKTVALPAEDLQTRVSDLDVSGPVWYAASASGLYTSKDQGKSWQGGELLGHSAFVRVAILGGTVYAAGRQFILASNDQGVSWQPVAMPAQAKTLRFLVSADDGSLWMGGREGVFYSEDKGQTWSQLSSLPFTDVDGLDFDPGYKRLMVTSAKGTLMMAIDPVKKDWSWWDVGWNVHTVQSASGRLVAASLYDGVVLQPKSATGAQVASDVK
jgi:photosystem II stability/assembly factor-like uncharacterized protein